MPAPDDNFLFRPVSAGDKEEVLAFTANTWEGGDYIQWVFDEWVADATGCFLAAVDQASGKVAGIDKLAMLSPREAWFEGIRVNPEFRGRGLSGLMQRRMLVEAEARGASVVRLLTAPDNIAIHRIAYRDGFSMRFRVRHWEWEAAGHESGAQEPSQSGLRPAAPEEADLLFDWWAKSGSCYSTGGMLDRGWVFSETSRTDWVEMAAAQRIFISHTVNSAHLVLPPPVLIVEPRTGRDNSLTWHLTLIAATTKEEWSDIARRSILLAREHGVAHIDGLIADIVPAYFALEEAGFRCGSWEGFVLFERRL